MEYSTIRHLQRAVDEVFNREPMAETSDKKIKHFIFSKFFPYQRRDFPYNVLDVNFLSKQLVLSNNILRSLENQTNKDFELVFIPNAKFFDNPKYEFIFTTLKNSTTLPIKFIKQRDIPGLIKDTYEKYDFVIQSRMDFDDFVYKNAVAETHSKVNECDNILAYGYCKGYQYIYGELYHCFSYWGGGGHLTILQSLILKSSFAKNLPFIVIDNFNHTKIKLSLKEFLEKNSVEFSENMFQQNISTDAYIYFRHEFSQQQLIVHPGKSFNVSKLKLLSTADITKKELEEKFGFFHELKSIE